MKPGEYKITINANDNDEKNPLESERRFTIKAVAPSVVQAETTQITSIIGRKSGNHEVWVNNRMTGQLHQLNVGDEFKLDDATWTIRSINVEGQEVEMEANGKIMTFKRGKFLNQAKKSTPIASTSNDQTIVKDDKPKDPID